ncbi:class II myosin, partial [Coemansia aciculifera]
MLVRNLTQYAVVLTEEQKRMQELQRQLKKKEELAAADSEEQAAGDKPERVGERAKLVCRAGAVALLVSAVQPRMAPSDSVRDAVAEIMAALAVSPELRGLLVQQGGVRALLGTLLTSDAPKAGMALRALRQQRDKHAAFALAKIGISVPPHLAFADVRQVARLLLCLLLEDTEPQALLMRFEALLALTNLASAPPGSAADIRGYLANDLEGFPVIETCVLSEHPMVRRAATELVCNLVYDQRVFERFAANSDSGVPPPEQDTSCRIVEIDDAVESEEDLSYRSKRLHLLVALADVDDMPTRSAAAGALAVLSSDPRCCRYLFLAHPRASSIFLSLVRDTEEEGESDDGQAAAVGFKHRVAVIWANAASCGDSRVSDALRRESGVVESLRLMASDS